MSENEKDLETIKQLIHSEVKALNWDDLFCPDLEKIANESIEQPEEIFSTPVIHNSFISESIYNIDEEPPPYKMNRQQRRMLKKKLKKEKR